MVFFICICRDSFEIEIEDFSSLLETAEDDEDECPGSIQVKEETQSDT